jgi:hypothetical protein
VLWLADNRIRRLQGLSHLGRLRHLHLARNDVRVVGGALAALTGLQMLNLADNPVCHFQVGGTQRGGLGLGLGLWGRAQLQATWLPCSG